MRYVTLLAALSLALLGIVGCTPATPAADPTALIGEWNLQATTDFDADLGAANITAVFTAEEVSGFSGVNQYGGSYTAKDDGSIEFGEMRSTLMAGPDAAMRAEAAYLKALGEVNTFKVEGETLTLSSDGITLTYKKAKSAALPGTQWVVTGFNNAKEAVVGVSADSTITLDFGTDKTLSGNSGVNTYNGSFQVRDDTIQVGEIAVTMMAGPDDLMEQERLYLDALKKSVSWKVTNGMLEMRDWNGAMQVIAVAPDKAP